MRSVQIDASAHPSSDVVLPPAASPPCVASRALSELCCVTPDLSHPTSCLPSHRDGFATRPSLRSAIKRDRFYEGSDSRRSHAARRVSPLTPRCLPAIPIPTTRSVRGSLSASPQRPRSFQASPSSSRLATGTRRIRFVLLQTGSSPPVAPHPGSRRRSCLRLHGYDTPRRGLAPRRQRVLTDALDGRHKAGHDAAGGFSTLTPGRGALSQRLCAKAGMTVGGVAGCCRTRLID